MTKDECFDVLTRVLRDPWAYFAGLRPDPRTNPAERAVLTALEHYVADYDRQELARRRQAVQVPAGLTLARGLVERPLVPTIPRLPGSYVVSYGRPVGVAKARPVGVFGRSKR